MVLHTHTHADIKAHTCMNSNIVVIYIAQSAQWNEYLFKTNIIVILINNAFLLDSPISYPE